MEMQFKGKLHPESDGENFQLYCKMNKKGYIDHFIIGTSKFGLHMNI